jgi:hypothetical protein
MRRPSDEPPDLRLEPNDGRRETATMAAPIQRRIAMNRLAALAGVTLATGFLGCARSERTASAACPDSWAQRWTADSSIALCTPPGFVPLDDHTWQRPSPTTGEDLADFFSVELLRWPDDSAAVRGWPPRLASLPSCRADCITVDSSFTYRDRWGDFDAHTDVGLASGGVADLKRRPVMASGWIVSNDRRGFAQGWTAMAATLDTLRQMLRTVRITR